MVTGELKCYFVKKNQLVLANKNTFEEELGFSKFMKKKYITIT